MVELQNIYKSFGSKKILENFSYSFPQNGFFAITGESGKGKTTFLRLIAHLENADKGVIKAPRKIAYSFQEYRLFPNLTVRENIALISFEKVTPAENELIDKYLKKLALFEEAECYPDELSGGMKQRVSLIRAFVSRASVVLLDEPTKELDDKLSNIVVEIIQELAKTKLVIVSLHNEEFAKKIGAQIIKT